MTIEVVLLGFVLATVLGLLLAMAQLRAGLGARTEPWLPELFPQHPADGAAVWGLLLAFP